MPSSIHPREPHPDPTSLTKNPNTSSIDYTPHPESSLQLSPSRQKIASSICALYSGSASESDMQVYAPTAIYDDPWSYCDDRYKIAGQWYGIPKMMGSSKTLATEVVKNGEWEVVFKLRQEYRPKMMPVGKAVDSLVSLSLEGAEGEERVVYHKDMWNEKDYSHEGLGKMFKSLNGDHLTKITQPPEGLKPEEQKSSSTWEPHMKRGKKFEGGPLLCISN